MNKSTTLTPISLDPTREIYESWRRQIRATINDLLREELDVALGAVQHERSAGRRGYRHGLEPRQVSTEVGLATVDVPRARLFDEDGKMTEWQSQVLPRYQRRTQRVEEAILSCYLGGINTRKLRRSLEALLGDENLSRSAVSRVVCRLKDRFEQWSQRDLSEERYVYLYLDATNLKMRVGKRVVQVPVHAVLGVREDGQKVLVALEAAGREVAGSWKSLVSDLAGRGLRSPELVILDGLPGLVSAVQSVWNGVAVQRCTKHKLENLLQKAPKHIQGEVKRDYDAIVYAKDKVAAQKAYQAFVKKWNKGAKSVAKSLEEAGEHLITFYDFPKSQWKSLRTTNSIERLNEEFKRRTKTQGSFRHESSALVLLYGLLAIGHVRLRKIDGYRDIAQAVDEPTLAAA